MAYAVHLLAYRVHQVRLLMYMMAYATLAIKCTAEAMMYFRSLISITWVYCIFYHVNQEPHLVYCNCQQVYTPVLPLVLDDGVCSTPAGKYSTPIEAPEVHTHHGLCSTLDGKCSTPKWLKWGSWSTCTTMASAVHLMANAVHPSEYSDAPEVHTHHGKCSTPKWLKWGSWSTS